MELLFNLKEKGSLPSISPQLGKHVRTNSESLIGARMPHYHEDLSQGIAIGSGVYIDEHTHIEAVRFPNGSDTMAPLTTILTNGQPGPRRIGLWVTKSSVRFCATPTHPARLATLRMGPRICDSALYAGARQSDRDALAASWFWPFRKSLCSRGEKIPTYIPKANKFAEKFAELTGGFPMSMLPEILFDIPGTAHCIGGCVIADSSARGVVDSRHRVFGYKNMYICDGSLVAANLGVNPSLTITALAERAMTFIPAASQNTWDDAAHDGPPSDCKPSY